MAMDFEDSSSQACNLVAVSPAVQAVSACTLMAWCRLESLPPGRHNIFAFSRGDTGTLTRAKISHQGTALEASGRVLDSDTFQAFSTGTLLAGVRYHVAAVFDYVARKIELFLNGVSIGISGTLTGWTSGSTTNLPSLTASIGSQHGGGSEFVDGILEDLRCYNRKLSADELMSIVEAEGTDRITNGLRHRFRLDEAAPGTVASGIGSVKDIGPLRINATPQNSPIYAESYISRRKMVRI